MGFYAFEYFAGVKNFNHSDAKKKNLQGFFVKDYVFLFEYSSLKDEYLWKEREIFH